MRDEQALVVMRMDHIEVLLAEHPAQHLPEQRVEHEQLAVGRSGRDPPVRRHVRDAVHAHGCLANILAQVVRHHVHVMAAQRQRLRHPEDPDRRSPRVRERARRDHRDAQPRGRPLCFRAAYASLGHALIDHDRHTWCGARAALTAHAAPPCVSVASSESGPACSLAYSITALCVITGWPSAGASVPLPPCPGGAQPRTSVARYSASALIEGYSNASVGGSLQARLACRWLLSSTAMSESMPISVSSCRASRWTDGPRPRTLTTRSRTWSTRISSRRAGSAASSSSRSRGRAAAPPPVARGSRRAPP